jgi:hypothetical protein
VYCFRDFVFSWPKAHRVQSIEQVLTMSSVLWLLGVFLSHQG